ncbi:MAG: Mrp/NBP35 family ATP-binding protein [Spirochaetes bacterium]|nr:Mrp/NBP35 family ATP-binding protein [Spirochaetota bacterium]
MVDEKVKENMTDVDHTVVVLSGKGGVGKSTVAVNLAVSLAERGYKTGLLDVDLHGPSVPTLLGLEGTRHSQSADGKIMPILYNGTLKTVSVGFLTDSRSDAMIWRGPMKHNVIKQFLTDVDWGELDFLIIDSPPGTGDEVLAVCQLIENPDGAVIVTTPQDLALVDVAKSITFCEKLNIPRLGVIENMSGFSCPHCGKISDLFKRGGGKKIADISSIPFLGEIPISTGIPECGDSGKPFMVSEDLENEVGISFKLIVDVLLKENFPGLVKSRI